MLLIVAASTYSGMVKLRGKLSRNTTTTNNNNNDANINATAEERALFEGSFEGMTAGWGGTMVQLEAFLSEAR